MVDFIKFVKDHPGIDVKIEYWHGSPRGIVITMTKYPPMKRFRFCIQEELYFDNPYNLDVDTYIEMWLNNGLKELNKED
jgi:hypothetical protein